MSGRGKLTLNELSGMDGNYTVGFANSTAKYWATASFSIPAGALVAGTHTLTINVASGSGSVGFLSTRSA